MTLAGLRLAARLKELLDPVANSCLHFRKPAFKKMLRAFHKNKLLRLGSHGKDLPEILLRAKLIARAADEQLGPGAVLKKFVGVHAAFNRYRCAERHQPRNSSVRTRGPQARSCSKGEAAEQKR